MGSSSQRDPVGSPLTKTGGSPLGIPSGPQIASQVLACSLQEKKKHCDKKGSQILARVAASTLFRKYKLIGHAAGIFGYTRKPSCR